MLTGDRRFLMEVFLSVRAYRTNVEKIDPFANPGPQNYRLGFGQRSPVGSALCTRYRRLHTVETLFLTSKEKSLFSAERPTANQFDSKRISWDIHRLETTILVDSNDNADSDSKTLFKGGLLVAKPKCWDVRIVVETEIEDLDEPQDLSEEISGPGHCQHVAKAHGDENFLLFGPEQCKPRGKNSYANLKGIILSKERLQEQHHSEHVEPGNSRSSVGTSRGRDNRAHSGHSDCKVNYATFLFRQWNAIKAPIHVQTDLLRNHSAATPDNSMKGVNCGPTKMAILPQFGLVRDYIVGDIAIMSTAIANRKLVAARQPRHHSS
ncbi:uncharacterized protein EV420DRAFT_1748394 [Desarmillaria tabescens]|uniref:Uncharacterized protein n=1 Tax=Armillaria tabescens TaxID=1929756 RepID=A0AA39KE31_ARMTA|nr:uncharacterized protein EV420DRAFT_1748394 [Desarmillaria tabescens]KAK0458094.1 hypothetical protein EV420DRAFT_1748394 [Desarmillaria tabescens]